MLKRQINSGIHQKIRNWLADNEGIWNVNKPVVLDNKLTIDAGAKIQFSESSYPNCKRIYKSGGYGRVCNRIKAY